MNIERTNVGLAEAMFQELEALQAGSSTAQMARAKSAVANTIIHLSRLQMDYARFVADSREKDGTRVLPNLSMGKDGKVAT